MQNGETKRDRKRERERERGMEGGYERGGGGVGGQKGNRSICNRAVRERFSLRISWLDHDRQL